MSIESKRSWLCLDCGAKDRTSRKLDSCRKCGGSIKQTSVRHYPRPDLGRDAEGKRLRKSEGLGGYATQRDAKAAEGTIQHHRREGTFQAPSKRTLSELSVEWLEAIQSEKIRPSTIAMYEMNFRNRIEPELGRVRLDRLETSDWMRLDNKLKARGLSQSSRHQARVTVSKILDYAVQRGYVARNTAKLAPKIGQAVPKPVVWDAAALRTFLEATKEDRLFPAFLLAASLGLRRGEVCGLEWKHLDLHGGSVKIERALVSVGYKVMLSEPKTQRGYRTLDLSPDLVAVLKAHKAQQGRERLALGPAYAASEHGDLVFTRPEGGTLHPQTLSDCFERYVKQLGLPKISLHGLRHSFATAALEERVPLWIVSSALGHGGIAITDKYYRGEIRDANREATSKVSARIFGS